MGCGAINFKTVSKPSDCSHSRSRLEDWRTRMNRALRIVIFGALLLLHGMLHAETGAEAWLRYAPLGETQAAKYSSLPASVVVLGDSLLLHSAQQEVIRGTRGMLGRTLREAGGQVREESIVLGTIAALNTTAPA